MAAQNEPGGAVANLTFEQAVERLEGIVADIEGGRLGLEQSITQYEQGVALVGRCREILARQEQRVEELGKRVGPTDAGVA